MLLVICAELNVFVKCTVHRELCLDLAGHVAAVRLADVYPSILFGQVDDLQASPANHSKTLKAGKKKNTEKEIRGDEDVLKRLFLSVFSGTPATSSMAR